MKLFKYFVLLFTTSLAFSQTTIDSLTIKKLKLEIKEELLKELQNKKNEE